jgi:S1-C subfamily serine protease
MPDVLVTQTVNKYRLPRGSGDPTLPVEPVREGPRLGLRAADHEDTGVRITAIAPNSPASRAGFNVGEIITTINGGAVRNEATFSDAVDNSARTMSVTLQTAEGATRTVTVEMGW